VCRGGARRVTKRTLEYDNIILNVDSYTTSTLFKKSLIQRLYYYLLYVCTKFLLLLHNICIDAIEGNWQDYLPTSPYFRTNNVLFIILSLAR
jgi:hypothetical protein